MRKLVLLLSFTILFISCKNEDNRKVKTAEIKFKKEGELTISKASGDFVVTLDIEIAETAYERETGLMYRTSMEDNQGMLFVFSSELPKSFYMKNTYIPLDIIYLNKDLKIVSFQENAVPLSETSLSSEVPAMYVLEVNAGLAEKWLLEIGDFISFEKH